MIKCTFFSRLFILWPETLSTFSLFYIIKTQKLPNELFCAMYKDVEFSMINTI